METGGSPAIITSRKTTLTPKAIINLKYGKTACYTIEEVQEPPQNECPGLFIPQKGTCHYRCSLQLPEISVVSGIFRRKKDAEQSAAEIAIEKLGIHHRTEDPTVEEAWNELVDRLKYLFSDKFFSSLDPPFHPLSGHFRASLKREGDLCCSIPMSVIPVYDSKFCNLSKFIDSQVESNPFLVVPLIVKAARRLSESLIFSEGWLSIRRKNPYPPDIIKLAIPESSSSGRSLVETIYIPCSLDKPLEAVTLDLSSSGYYLDVIAKQLGLSEAAKVSISRPVGKASSDTRLYFAAPDSFLLDLSSDHLATKEDLHFEGTLNTRASYLYGQDIYGDAVLASIGYTWKFKELFHEDVSLQSYYRMLMRKTPSGAYKLSREAVLTAELPLAFTTRSNWKGSLPKDILFTFCRQQRWSEPIISTVSIIASSKSPEVQRLKTIDSAAIELECANGVANADGVRESIESGSSFRCELRIYSKSQDLILECLPRDSYKKQTDAMQNVSLKVISWLNAYFMDLDMPLERLSSSADSLSIRFSPQVFYKEIDFCKTVHYCCSQAHRITSAISKCENVLDNLPEQGDRFLKFEGPDSGVSPSNGCLACIGYSVSLVTEGEQTRESIESSKEFEFEMGSGAVISCLEVAVSQMSVGQSACFSTQLLCQELILAAACDSSKTLPLLNYKACFLEYSVTLLGFTEPLEERMEQALFSPPLAKQRVEFALQCIKESRATTLVDFGCGSGSLLDSLIGSHTSLEKVVGVDISPKSLSRAAKVLHSKLSTESDTEMPLASIKSLALYDGSIIEFDPRMCGFDVGTCLEVIEHMEEDQAYLFGNLVLSSFCPKVLVVSTPNYEYNAILQGSNPSFREEDEDDKTQSKACRFRNHDHKFEWTREQFNRWATELGTSYNYSVTFTGVGGSADLEPGFASQIAVFRREGLTHGDGVPNGSESAQPYQVIWEWKNSNTN